MHNSYYMCTILFEISTKRLINFKELPFPCAFLDYLSFWLLVLFSQFTRDRMMSKFYHQVGQLKGKGIRLSEIVEG